MIDLSPYLPLPSIPQKKKTAYLRSLCSPGPTKGSNPSAAGTTIGFDAKKGQTELRSPCHALCGEGKKTDGLRAGFYFPHSGRPSEESGRNEDRATYIEDRER